jgi:hypothetical protein
MADDDSKQDSPNAYDSIIQDFVVVTLSLSSADDDVDDNSYDYCEDACSLLSSDEHEHGLLCDNLEMTNDSLYLKDSILTLASVLMKDLDEAHAAASLTRIADIADHSAGGSSSLGSSEELRRPDEHHCDCIRSFRPPTMDEVEENESYYSAVVDEEESPTTTNASSEDVDCKKTPSSSTRTCESLSTLSSCGQDVGTVVAAGEKGRPETSTAPLPLVTTRTQQDPVNASKVDVLNISRTSNKKRRKKLRLLKKAQAAASAAHKLSERSLETLTMPKTTIGRNNPQQQSLRVRASSSRGSSKKIANIAVVCAKETMSAYREELMRTKETTIGA